LLRVHYQHPEYDAVALEAISLPYGKFIMVTKEYETVQVSWDGITKSYIDWLHGLLLGAQCYVHPTSNSIVFC
jgi:hypothetical protein